MRRSYFASCAVGVLMAGVVLVVYVERVRQWGNGAPEAVGFRGEVGGTVRSLDVKTRVVRIARGMLDYSSIPISVTNDSRVNIRGRLGAFGDLREGLSLSICYEVTPSGRWARSIDMPPSPGPCGAVASSAPEPSGDDPGRPIAVPGDPPSSHVVPDRRALAQAPLVTPPARVVSRPAPTPTGVGVGEVSPGSRRETPAVRTRALETEADASRRPASATRSSEDYAAVIGWVLRERASVARPSSTESALARPERNSQTESAAAATSHESTMRSAEGGAPGESAPAPSSERAESPDLRSAALVPGAPAASDGSSPAVVPEAAGPIAALQHRSEGAAIAKPTCPDIAEALQHDSSVDGRSRKQRIVDCVGGWLKEESQEFRDGFKRGIEEFRTGVENFGRGLQRLGEKLRR